MPQDQPRVRVQSAPLNLRREFSFSLSFSYVYSQRIVRWHSLFIHLDENQITTFLCVIFTPFQAMNWRFTWCFGHSKVPWPYGPLYNFKPSWVSFCKQRCFSQSMTSWTLWRHQDVIWQCNTLPQWPGASTKQQHLDRKMRKLFSL